MKKFSTRICIYILLALIAPVSAVHAQELKDADEYLKAALKETNQNSNYPKAITLCKAGLELSPSYPDLHLLLGRLYFLTKDYPQARGELKYVLDKSPGNYDALNYLINLESQAGNDVDALCYVDEALYNNPGNKTLLLKKSSLLNNLHDYEASYAITENLLTRYPKDSALYKQYVNQRLEGASKYMASTQYSKSRYALESVLDHDPHNAEAMEYMIRLDNAQNGPEGALNTVNRALLLHPYDYNYLKKKAAILEELRRYPEAIELLQKNAGRYPSFQQQLTDVRLAAGRYYLQTDPYTQFASVLQNSPNNKEALHYALNIALSRNNYDDALNYVNKALKTAPSDEELLLKKSILLEKLDNPTGAAQVMKQLVTAHPFQQAYVDRYTALCIKSGKAFQAEQQTDSAVRYFREALSYNPGDMQAMQYLVNTYSAAQQNDSAIAILDQCLAAYPNKEEYLFKKAGLLASIERYPESIAIQLQLVQEHPDNLKYRQSLIDINLLVGKKYLQEEDYAGAQPYLQQAVELQPRNIDALNYLINAQSAQQHYDSALLLCNQALTYSPDNKDLLLKKAAILESDGRYTQAYAITGSLLKRYPFHAKIKQAYIDQRLAAGRGSLKRQQGDSARTEFNSVLAVAPKDTLALYGALQASLQLQQPDAAIAYANTALGYYPASEQFLLKKTTLLENQQRFPEAAALSDTLLAAQPDNARYKDYNTYLHSRTARNEAGVFWLHTSYDSTTAPRDIVTLHYLHHFDKWSLAGRINYAPRNTGNGFQFELESYITHNTHNYSQIFADYSNNQFFPKWKLGYSFFHNFKHGWEGEIGLRYLNTDSLHTLSYTAAITKTIGHFWLNLRGYAIPQYGKLNTAFSWTNRLYINNDRDYVGVILATGSSIDDPSRIFLLNQSLQFITKSVAVTYQKTINYYNVLSATYTLTNQKLVKDIYQNQHLLYLTYIRKF